MRRQNKKKLYRSSSDRLVAGVLGGLARYLHINSNLLRVIYAIATVLTGFFPFGVLYLLMIVIIPPEPDATSWFNLFRNVNDTINHFQKQHSTSDKQTRRELHNVKVDDVHDDSIESHHH